MKIPKSIFPPVLLSFFLAGPVLSEGTAEMEKLRFEFQVDSEELKRPLQELNETYRGHLEKQKAAFQQAGDLEAMLATEEELKSYNGAPGALSPFPALSRLQEIYRTQKKKLEGEIARARAELNAAYGKKAGELAAQWTKEGRIEAAKTALVESKRYEAMGGAFPQVSEMGPLLGRGGGPGEKVMNGLGMKLCWIPAGKFTMGSPGDEKGRRSTEAQVEVTLTRGYWMGKFEVTQEEYEKVMGNNPSKFQESGGRAPVEQVSWEDAMTFCRKLTELERKNGKLPEGWVYTLPTEAQWEYACRSGSAGAFSGGTLPEVGWYKDNSSGKTHVVGEKKANGWRLYDMHGNVREWTADWFAETLRGGRDPTGPASGDGRVPRGGSWFTADHLCRAASRDRGIPANRNSALGFRVSVQAALSP